MARINVRELQTAIRQRYKEDPQAAHIRLRVRSTQADLSDPAGFTGNGYMLLGLDASGVAAQYRDESVQRGGPMMLVVTPTLPTGQGLSHACAVYGSSVLVLPDAKLDAVHIAASLCTQGEINEALLYANLSVVGTHAAVWTTRD